MVILVSGKKKWKTGELAKLTGLTIRTLRYYDQIELFSPSDYSEAGYRLYNATDLSRLQQILSLKDLGLTLEEIKSILADDTYNPIEVVSLQIERLRENIRVQQKLLKDLQNVSEILQTKDTLTVEDFTNSIGMMKKVMKIIFTGAKRIWRANLIDLANSFLIIRPTKKGGSENEKHFATHDTFVIEKVYNFTPEVVFAAWAKPELKAKWFTEAEEFEFRVGGQEKNHGGPPGGPVYTFKAHYQEIIPDHRIVYSYTMDLDETRISVSVATVEFKQIDEGTHLIFTEQGAFLDGHDTAAVREHGTSILLDQLGEQLKNNQELTVSSGVSKIINSPEPISDREIVNKRIFNVPREIMFKAFSDPNHLEKWWGPEGFTNTFHEFDMRPNGIWRFIMHGPNGVDYENKSIFSEIIEPERLLSTIWGQYMNFLLTITFAEKEGKTELIWQMLHKSVKECERVRSFCYEANEQNFNRLEAELTKMVN